MGKRSNFERRPDDFYPTPRAAVVPLIPYLRRGGVRTFAEPCAGEGDLVRHLEAFGLRCVYQGDITTGQDALARNYYGAADVIITNPPYKKPLMHELIRHLMGGGPTWLLLELDWAANEHAAPLLPHCSDIVAIGRVKWIEGSKHTGKDNHAWYRFDAGHKGVTALHRRNQGEEIAPLRRVEVCEQCRKPYQPQRSTSRFCSPACRQRAHHRKLSVRLSVTPTPDTAGSEVFRYVLHADVPRFVEEGWQATPALDGTHHGEYSVLMRRIEGGIKFL